jgi:hypothetical protein
MTSAFPNILFQSRLFGFSFLFAWHLNIFVLHTWRNALASSSLELLIFVAREIPKNLSVKTFNYFLTTKYF